VTISTVLDLLRRRWLPLVLCLIAGLGGAAAHSTAAPKLYKSSARLFINVPAASSTQEALQGTQLSAQLMQSYADIVTSRTAAEQIKNQLSLPDSVGAIAAKLSATPKANSLILTVSATDRDAKRAQAIADAAAGVLNDTVRNLEHDRTPASAVEATIVDHATVPSSPVSPQPKRDLLIGLVLGLVAGLALMLVLDALDRTLKNPLDVEGVVGAPRLGAVPAVRDPKVRLVTAPKAPVAIAEAYRSLRTSLRFIDPDSPVRALVITSATDGEGKSTTALNLAHALGQAGERVVLVDCDLRKRGLTKMLRAENSVGLTSVLSGVADLDASLLMHEGVAVLGAGPTPPNPAEMLGSQRMSLLIDDLQEQFDVVLFDTPPVLPVTDAVVLSAQVGAALMVVRYGRTTRNHAEEAVRRLNGVDAGTIGFVLHGVPKSKGLEYSSLGYGDDAVMRTVVSLA
jgi:receptor protein-tyrosine kinase